MPRYNKFPHKYLRQKLCLTLLCLVEITQGTGLEEVLLGDGSHLIHDQA